MPGRIYPTPESEKLQPISGSGTSTTPVTLYKHTFTTAATSPPVTTYSVTPDILNTSLTTTGWVSSTGNFTSYTGASGNALSLSTASATTTNYTLSLSVGAGKTFTATSFSFWNKTFASGSNTGYTNWSLSIGGIAVGSGSLSTAGASTGTLTISNPVTNLTGTIAVVLTLSGGSHYSSATFRLDDFIVNGYIQLLPGAVTSGANTNDKAKYPYGFNSHIKSDEISGEGNNTSALFGEYDTRLIRRWNKDPKANASISLYSVFSNNPIWFNDILLDTPTVKEAALMDKLVYGDKLSKDDQVAFNKSGWQLSGKATGVEYNKKSGLKSALFERTLNGKTEYTYAFAGTEGLINKDTWNDIVQVVGLSTQIGQAIDNTKKIIQKLGTAEITLSGHSLGGALANASALATGKVSLTFNPAWLSTATMLRFGLTFKPQSGLTNYVILGEILNSVQRAANPNPIPQMNLLQNVGKTHFLFSALPLVPIYGALKSHSIDEVIDEIKDVPDYNKVKSLGSTNGE